MSRQLIVVSAHSPTNLRFSRLSLLSSVPCRCRSHSRILPQHHLILFIRLFIHFNDPFRFQPCSLSVAELAQSSVALLLRLRHMHRHGAARTQRLRSAAHANLQLLMMNRDCRLLSLLRLLFDLDEGRVGAAGIG